ncbi:MAG: hypothetical protein R3344_07850 [Acidobacteriota bacterium]|nr:hypothetical protein [Acidobacteriota bacterium]
MKRNSGVRWSLIAITFLIALPAMGQDAGSPPAQGDTDWGLRVGLGSDPDQLIVGGQYDFGEIARRVHFEPNVELGFGDDTISLTGTGAFFYVWDRMGSVRPYAGGGPEIGIVWFDTPGGSDSDFEVGLQAMGGGRWKLKSGREFFVELDLGLFGDLHDIQVMAGWRF